MQDGWVKVEPVEKGWSHERKYHITTAGGAELLLRLADAERDPLNCFIFNVLGQFNQDGFWFSRPVAQGRCDNGRQSYLLLEWLVGEDAELLVPRLPLEAQYSMGIACGKILRTIHETPLVEQPKDTDWAGRYLMQREHKTRLYKECGVRLPGEQLFFDYVEQNKGLIAGRPQCIRHGDFHVGNLIIDPKTLAVGVIDFSRLCFGDPWADFVRLVFCADLSPAFATGRIDGYFPKGVPEGFFATLAFYIAHNAIGSIPWALGYGEKEVATALSGAVKVLEWYCSFESVIPNWYRRRIVDDE
jgi:serine/threonine-protein kinase